MRYSVFFFILFLFVLFYYKFKTYIPILMYHRIADVPHDRNALSPQKFHEQMKYLNQKGFTSITMQMLYDYYHTGKPLPAKPILLTFDDGYEDNFSTALPILKEYQMTAVVFPITHWIGKENKWENFNKSPTRTMNWCELSQWHAAGMEIASHTAGHPFLTKCSSMELQNELNESKRALEQQLHEPINFLCYPYGNFNHTVMAAAKNSGYKAAFAIFENVPLWKLNLFALPRIPIPARQSLWEFKLKTGHGHILFILLRKWERIIKKSLRKRIK